jgi:hypothetical protein
VERAGRPAEGRAGAASSVFTSPEVVANAVVGRDKKTNRKRRGNSTFFIFAVDVFMVFPP